LWLDTIARLWNWLLLRISTVALGLLDYRLLLHMLLWLLSFSCWWLQKLILLKITTHLVIINTLLKLDKSIIELQIESIALSNHRCKLFLNYNSLVQCFKELNFCWICLNLRQDLLKGLHVLLDSDSYLLLLSFKFCILLVVLLK
jgi:hypothetical protein